MVLMIGYTSGTINEQVLTLLFGHTFVTMIFGHLHEVRTRAAPETARGAHTL